MSIDIQHGDNRDILKELPDNSIDAIVTDPPYALEEHQGRKSRAPEGMYQTMRAGFMDMKWDNTDAFDPTIWRECYRILKPGGHMAVFGSPKTHHRLWTVIEDTGFELRDTVLWLYAQGMPKSLDVAKSIQAMQRKGNARFDNSDKHAFDHSAPTDLPGPMWIDGATGKWTGHNATTTDPQALQWQGWGTNLKPAHEPILIARKPIDKTVANTVLKHGTGAINIDACRVPPNGDPLGGGMLTSGRPTLNLDHNIDWDRPWMRNEVEAKRHKQEMKIKTAYAEQHGRWPANVIHDGSDEVLSGFPETRNGMTKWLNASRFFFSAKATAQDRNGSAHPTVKPVKLMEYLIKLITPPNGIIVDPFAGSGTTGQAAQNLGFDIILIERELQYINDIKRRFAPVEVLPEC